MTFEKFVSEIIAYLKRVERQCEDTIDPEVRIYELGRLNACKDILAFVESALGISFETF